MQVGIRELKANLSKYVRAARQGEIVQVTDRGKVVVEIAAPARTELTAEEKHVLATGGRLPTQPWRPLPIGEHAVDWEPIDVVALLDELRGDR